LCGIAGFTHCKRFVDPSRIRGAVTSLIHRGPDQQGVWESGAVSLGATRLKIIDLSHGDQPIVSSDGDAVIAFNGEIYNHAELRRELEQLGHRFQSQSDTEVVLEAFLEWDTACFARLRGMFGVALWTESKKRLVLARDRMGIKPLYIASRGGDLYFGSELKAILVHPEIERNLSRDGLDCYLALNYVPAPWTLVQGIEKLRPGHWLEWREGAELRTECYWRLPGGTERHWTLEDAKAELDSLLQQSVREHLISDVPLGLWLSGGVDSSTVLHYAANARPGIKTFSISFKGRSFDESSYIQQVVSAYGTDHQQLDLNPESNLQDAIDEFAYYSDEPDADAGALPVWFLSRLTRRSATVALSGEAADELFGGYLTYRANRLSQRVRRIPAPLLALAERAIEHWPVSDDKISLEYKLKRFLQGCRMSPERAHVYWNGTFSDAEKVRLVQSPLPPSLRQLLSELNLSGPDRGQDLRFDQQYFLPDDILTKVDRMSMAHAVEVRPPFLDHRIVEFAATLPMHLKIRGARQKFVLKELMRGKLPAPVLSRSKVGFDIPAHDWLRGPLRGLLFDTLSTGFAAHPNLFRRDAVDLLVSRHMDRSANVGYHVWGLMILFLWMQKWNIRTTSEQAASASQLGSSAFRFQFSDSE
jgi:asparagine synthase (glutamine-hydrolysing)